MRGDRGREERKTQEWIFSRGVKHGDKYKLRTALEWVVITSGRTARLELTKVLDAGKNWKRFQLGLEGNRRIEIWV